MLPLKQSLILSSLAALAVLPIGACANSPWASQLERSLAADPRLRATLDVPGQSEASPQGEAQLPSNFPVEIPRYPNASLVAVTGATGTEPNQTLGNDQSVQTSWQTVDSVAQVEQFYREQFQAGGWQLNTDTNTDTNTGTGENSGADPGTSPGPLRATRDGLEAVVAAQTVNNATELKIDYRFNSGATAEVPNPAPNAAPSEIPGPSPDLAANVPQPGDPEFVGPLPNGLKTEPITVAPPTGSGETGTPATAGPGSYSDIGQAPAELQGYIADLAKLGILPNQPDFKPNAEITRREYAEWLVAANNRIYANQPARKIRLAAASDQPTFQDVPSSDPGFSAIQGLANAGLIPSTLSGDASASFRPDAPLTREDMLLWKVPVDLRQALPNASVESVQQAWGFQDSAKIDPKALRAILADHQNGDLSNIRRAFGYTTLLQPQKTVSRAEAASALWQFGSQGSSLNAKDAPQGGELGG